jgi:hypothetical protein
MEFDFQSGHWLFTDEFGQTLRIILVSKGD